MNLLRRDLIALLGAGCASPWAMALSLSEGDAASGVRAALERGAHAALANLLDAGIICGPAGPNVVRFLPPLIITQEHIDRLMPILQACAGELGW